MLLLFRSTVEDVLFGVTWWKVGKNRKHSTKESVNGDRIKDSKCRDARLNFINTHPINSALRLAATIAGFRLGQWIGCDSLSDEQERIVQSTASRRECTQWLFMSTASAEQGEWVNGETGEFRTYQTVLYVNIGTSDCTEYFAAFERETAYHAHHLRTRHRRMWQNRLLTNRLVRYLTEWLLPTWDTSARADERFPDSTLMFTNHSTR